MYKNRGALNIRAGDVACVQGTSYIFEFKVVGFDDVGGAAKIVTLVALTYDIEAERTRWDLATPEGSRVMASPDAIQPQSCLRARLDHARLTAPAGMPMDIATHPIVLWDRAGGYLRENDQIELAAGDHKWCGKLWVREIDDATEIILVDVSVLYNFDNNPGRFQSGAYLRVSWK